MQKVLGVLKTLVAIFLLVIAIGFTHAYMGLESTSSVFTKNNIENVVKNIDVVDLIDDDVKKDFFDSLEKAGVKKEVASDILNNEKLKTTAVDYLTNLSESLFENKPMPEIKEKEVNDIIAEIVDGVFKETNIKLSKKEQKEIDSFIEETSKELTEALNEVSNDVNEYINENPSVTNVDGKDVEVIKTIQAVYKCRFYLLLGVIIPLALIVLVKLKEKRFINWLITYGAINIVLFAAIAVVLPYLWNTYAAVEAAEMYKIFNPSINAITSTYVFGAFVLCILTAALIVTKVLLNKRSNKNA